MDSSKQPNSTTQTNQGNIKGFFILGAVILIIAGVAFYWFAYRPEKIRRDCYKEATGSLREVFGQMDEASKDSNLKAADLTKLLDLQIELCLKEHGQ